MLRIIIMLNGEHKSLPACPQHELDDQRIYPVYFLCVLRGCQNSIREEVHKVSARLQIF